MKCLVKTINGDYVYKTYKGNYHTIDDLPSVAMVGTIAHVLDTDEFYIYRTKWDKTNLFTSEDEFKDYYGRLITRYLIFGANIVKLEDIKISSNIASFDLETSLLPRYL